MSDEVYERLADQLDSLPNAFPRTKSGVEIRLLKKMVSLDDAKLAGLLDKNPEPVASIAERAGLEVEETTRRLQSMLFKGIVRIGIKKGVRGFRLTPFVVGLYEAQLKNMDHELAHLFDAYMMQGGARGILEPQPALHRVIPAQTAITKTEEIMPYDDVKAILSQAKSFSVRDCICRVERTFHDHHCKFPVRNCVSFSMVERPAGPNDISQDEAMAIIDETEEVGLIHTVTNVADGWGYVCNCCGCCCAIMRGITEWGIDNSVAKANYFAEVDGNHCSNCQLCYDRCHVSAISENDDRVAAVDLAKCIGCGLCVSACPDKLIHLHKRPDHEVVHPPANFDEWERARLANRFDAK